MFACCDESGIHKKSGWAVFGAIWLPDDSLLPGFECDATALRQRTKCWGEFKWQNLTGAYLEAYQGLIELALGLPDIKFTSMVVELGAMTRAEMQRYHGKGGRDEAYLKFMRLLLRERMKRWADQGTRKFTLLYDRVKGDQELRGTFTSVLRSDVRKMPGCELAHLSQVNSATSHLMQAADLLTGATWSAWMKEPESSSTKRAARAAVTRQFEMWTGGALTRQDFWSDRYYSLWKFEPRSSDAH
jgi:hypothetical protein